MASQKQDKARLSKVTKTASRLISGPVSDLQVHSEAKAVKRLEAIQRDLTHPPCELRPTLLQDLQGEQFSGHDKPVPLATGP